MILFSVCLGLDLGIWVFRELGCGFVVILAILVSSREFGVGVRQNLCGIVDFGNFLFGGFWCLCRFGSLLLFSSWLGDKLTISLFSSLLI